MPHPKRHRRKRIWVAVQAALVAANFAAIVLTSDDAGAAACNSTVVGNWGTAGTWNCGGANRVPTFGDNVTITVGNNVTVNVTTANTTNITVPANANLKVSSGNNLLLGNAATPGSLSISGNMIANSSINILGTTTINSGGNISMTANATGQRVFNGSVTVASGGAFFSNVNAPVIFVGNLAVNGTWNTAGAATGNFTFNGSNTTISGNSAISMPNVTITGTVTNQGNLTVTTNLAGAGTLTNASGATLTILDNTITPTLVANAVNNLVNYNLNGAQTVKANSYYDLILGNSGAKTMTGVTAIGGNLTISGSATMTSNANLVVSGALNYSSSGSTTLTAASPIVIGTYNQSAGTLVDNGNSITVTGTGASTWTKSAGTFTATGTVTFNGSAPQIGASNFNNLTINVGNTATLTGSATISSNLTVSGGILDLGSNTANRTAAGGTLTVANGACLRIGGAGTTFPANFSTHALGATCTVEYNGSNQAVTAEASTGYGNLILSGSGTDTMSANASNIVRGVLTVGANVTFSAGAANTVTVNGNVSNSGTISTGNITLANGSHTLSGTGSYSNLVLNDANGAALAANVTVNGNLNLSSGVFTTGSNTLVTTANCTTNVLQSGTSHVFGNLRLQFPAGTPTCTFHVGDAAAANYTPVTMSFANVTGAGALIGTVTNNGAANPGLIDATHDINRFWTFTLPAAGALSSTGNVRTAFTYLSGDNNGGAPSTYVVSEGNNSCAGNGSCGTWTLTTLTVTGSNTAITANTTVPFSTSSNVFAIGPHQSTAFLVFFGNSSVSTCTSQPMTIVAKDSANNTVTQYTGNVNITASSGRGDWSVTTANGTLNNGTADDGAAVYQFNQLLTDSGSVVLSLTSNHPNTNLTVTVTDSGNGSITGTSGTLSFSGANFVITNDTVQVAGRDQAMTVVMNGSSSCTNPLASYAGTKTIKASLTRDGADPGGNAPKIGAVSIPNANSTANVSLTFANGSANFSLTTTDVGKYTLTLLDDSGTFAGNVSVPINITGTSGAITTRPFALVVTGIRSGATNNPSGTATTGSKFVSAGTSFNATVGSYRWNSAADSNSDGVPDGTATLAQITANGLTPSFNSAVVLAATANFTPVGGNLASLGNGNIGAGSFSGGNVTVTTLSYSEVGSFTLDVSSTSFLGTAGADLTVANGKAIVFDSGSVRNQVVGRFYPDHFTLTSNSVTPACSCGGSFTYMDQAGLGYSFTIEARNTSDAKTTNYGTNYTTGNASVLAENNNNGTDLSARVTAPSGSWSGGSYSFNTSVAVFSRQTSPDGPYDSLQLGVKVTDPDGSVLTGLNMDPTSNGSCGGSCTGVTIGSTTSLRFGRLRILNATGQANLLLPITIRTEYWDSTSGTFKTNTLDTGTCTTLARSNITLGNYTSNLSACQTIINPATITFTSGVAVASSTYLTAPGVTHNGSVLLTPNLGSTASGNYCNAVGGNQSTATAANRAYLQGNWGGGSYNQNPSARGTFGVYSSQPSNFIYFRENY